MGDSSAAWHRCIGQDGRSCTQGSIPSQISIPICWCARAVCPGRSSILHLCRLAVGNKHGQLNEVWTLWTKFLLQPEPEFRPPMSEVVQALVRLVQRANMTKRMLDGDTSRRADDQDSDFIWRKQNPSLSGCIYFVRLAPSREGKTWKKKQRSLLVPRVHNHRFFMVTRECILWSMVVLCLQNSTLIVDLYHSIVFFG